MRKSLDLAESLGFRKRGYLRETFFWNGVYHDLVMLAQMERKRYGG